MSVLNLKTSLKLGDWGKRALQGYVDLHGEAVMIGLHAAANTHQLPVSAGHRVPLVPGFSAAP